jgi:GLPGLI family protein
MMKKITLYTLAILILSTGISFAQNAHFVNSGVIEFEKTANMYALFKRDINKDDESYMAPAFEAYKKNQPQFKKLQSTLSFSGNKTLFTPVEDQVGYGSFWGDDAMVKQNNTTFTDLAAGTFICHKSVFEETFLVKDTTRKIHWKITDETRVIAGYTCRRANALIMDSIYVVAFYTIEIPVSGGPESFTGLPGMILGVALPHENITWFATKVTETTIDDKVLTPPKKGKPVSATQLKETLNAALKDWGTWAQAKLKSFLL